MNHENRSHYLYSLTEFNDKRGGMVVLNSTTEIPFNIERVFCTYNTSGDSERGNHANMYSSFVMVSLAGSCVVQVDDGNNVTEYILDVPHKALFLSKGLWKRMRNFSPDNVLLVLSDCKYDESEYIRDYDKYINTTKRVER